MLWAYMTPPSPFRYPSVLFGGEALVAGSARRHAEDRLLIALAVKLRRLLPDEDLEPKGAQDDLQHLRGRRVAYTGTLLMVRAFSRRTALHLTRKTNMIHPAARSTGKMCSWKSVRKATHGIWGKMVMSRKADIWGTCGGQTGRQKRGRQTDRSEKQTEVIRTHVLTMPWSDACV